MCCWAFSLFLLVPFSNAFVLFFSAPAGEKVLIWTMNDSVRAIDSCQWIYIRMQWIFTNATWPSSYALASRSISHCRNQNKIRGRGFLDRGDENIRIYSVATGHPYRYLKLNRNELYWNDLYAQIWISGEKIEWEVIKRPFSIISAIST